MKGILYWVAILFLINQNCLSQSIKADSLDSNGVVNGLGVGDLHRVGIDSALVLKFFEQLKGQDHQIHSILLLKNQRLVLEKYFDDYTVDTPHDLRSATKSIFSLLVGIALDKGIIKGIDDPITEYLKKPVSENPDDISKITIRHLLTMSTGLDCNDWDKKSKGQEDKVYKKKDWLAYTLNLPMIYEPGDTSLYCTMGTMLAAEVVSQAAKMPIDTFAKKYLFDPLGIVNFHWGHTADDREVIPSAKRLYMTPRDMMKIGVLILNNGRWNSGQIVSQKWIEQSTAIHTKISNIDYGFLWWRLPFTVGENKEEAIAALGNGGQYIIVIPEQKMVIVFTGGAYNSPKDKFPFEVVGRIILPSLL